MIICSVILNLAQKFTSKENVYDKLKWFNFILLQEFTMMMDPMLPTLMLSVLALYLSAKHHRKLNLGVEWIFMMSSTHLSLWQKMIRLTSMEKILELIWERL